jgi:hypothetical protein
MASFGSNAATDKRRLGPFTNKPILSYKFTKTHNIETSSIFSELPSISVNEKVVFSSTFLDKNPDSNRANPSEVGHGEGFRSRPGQGKGSRSTKEEIEHAEVSRSPDVGSSMGAGRGEGSRSPNVGSSMGAGRGEGPRSPHIGSKVSGGRDGEEERLEKGLLEEVMDQLYDRPRKAATYFLLILLIIYIPD